HERSPHAVRPLPPTKCKKRVHSRRGQMRKTAAISGKSPPPRRILVLAFPHSTAACPMRASPELVARLTAASAQLTARRLTTARRVAAKLNVDVGVPAAGSPTAAKSGQ